MIKLPNRKRPEEIGKTNDSNYCLYHWIIGHPSKDCYILKDNIQTLIEARVIQLKAEQKRFIANKVTFQICSLEVLAGAMSILKAELSVVNYDPMACGRKG